MSTTYSSEVFDHFVDHLTAAKKAAHYEEALMRVGKVLCQHGLHDSVAIVLLHKHFDIQADARMVEVFGDGKAYIRPERVQDETLLTPYLWKLGRDQATPTWVWQPLEFVYTSSLPDELAASAAALVNRVAFFADLEHEFVRSDIHDIFGLAFLHRSTIFAVGPDERLVESTDRSTSTLTWSVVPNATLPPNLTRTYWKFQANGDLDEEQDCCKCG